jgi:hypothetical protein
VAKQQKIRVYLTDQEYAAVADMANANNLSVGKCFKVAGLQKINEVYAQVAARLAEKTNEEVIPDTTSPESEQLCESEAVEAE